MNNTDWLILKTLAKEKNITSVSNKLFITQPALTYRIKTLEQELGVTLLLRTTKGVTFTSEGLIVAQYATEMLKRYVDIKNTLDSMADVVRGSISIAISPAFMGFDFPKLLSVFKKKYPLVNINIITDQSSNCIELLLKNEVHLGLIRGDHNKIFKAHLLDVAFVTLVSQEKIDLKMLPKLPFIEYKTDRTLERDIATWWRDHYDSPPNTVMRVTDSHACREFVAEGLGFSILPAERRPSKNNFNLHEMKLTKLNGEYLTRSSWLLYKDYNEKITAVKIFIEFVLENLFPAQK